MNITIASLEAGARGATGIAVIIDVFRAFTTAAHAFASGAEKIIMVDNPAAAMALKDSGQADYCMGEVNSFMPDGFDFPNSPHALASADLAGKTLAQKTSNGTRGLLAAVNADIIYTGAFATAHATADCIRRRQPDQVSIVAMGAKEVHAVEDEICALYHRALLQDLSPDKAALKNLVTSLVPPPRPELLANGNYHPNDRQLALSPGSVDFAIRAEMENGQLIARPEFPA